MKCYIIYIILYVHVYNTYLHAKPDGEVKLSHIMRAVFFSFLLHKTCIYPAMYCEFVKTFFNYACFIYDSKN